MTVFAEKVNAVSNVIANMTLDPAERLGIVSALIEIYRHEITKAFVSVGPTVSTGEKNAETAPKADAASPAAESQPA